jgi:hypothetical protein
MAYFPANRDFAGTFLENAQKWRLLGANNGAI